MASINKFCERMRYWCDEANLGYCQAHRQNITEGGEADCSSLVIFALNEAGFETGTATYTGNIRRNLVANGWVVVPNDGHPQKGDILLNEGHHVAAWLGDCLAHASINELGKITGGAPGDQTGRETCTRSYYNFPWNFYLRYTGATTDEPEDGGKLKADGYWGPATTRALQRHFKTPVDGVVSDQYIGHHDDNPALTGGWEWNRKVKDGSKLIKAMQKWLKVEADGVIGPVTIKALQKKMGTHADGTLWRSSPCVKELQRRLNNGTL